MLCLQHVFRGVLAVRLGVIVGMFHCAAFIAPVNNADFVTVSVTKLRSHSTYERADCVAHNPDIIA